ncbi:MAG: TrkA family potassium uptake protein [Clostridiales bacterium]|nr:TrkA family potassium uptake protein [Clostridiales bacterium]
MKSYIIIGLGRFGFELAVRLYACGEEVLAIDRDEAIVNRIADRVTRAVVADAQDYDVLARLGADHVDRAVIAIGSDLGASALITMNLKTLKVPYVLCKAQNDTHKEILERLGANRVIIPERETADKLALGLTSTGIMEYIELSDEYGILEIHAPLKWAGRSIRELDLRSRFGANILATREGEKLVIPPDIDRPVRRDDIFVVLGPYNTIKKMENA